MQPLIDLLSIKDFTPYTYYLAWIPLLIRLDTISGLLSALVYYSIPVTLVYFIRQRKDFPYPWVVVLFAGFILACGTTHFLSALTVGSPLYWLDALLKGFTAVISVFTVALMVWFISRLSSLPCVTQGQKEIPQRQGSIDGWEGVNTHITECKHVKEALSEGESRFRFIADNAPVLIWIAGLDKGCHFFNKVWLQFTGRSMEQELGNGWVEGVHSEDYQYCLDTYLAAFDARQEFTREYRLHRFDGEYRWLQDKGVPRYDEQGVFLGYIGSCFDITERKQLVELLRESQALAEQANQVKSLFLATMSHEIRTPLNALLGTQELLANTSLDATQKSYLKIAKDAGTNLLMLVNDILDLTKVEAGKLELENTVFDAVKVINEVLAIVTEGAETKNIALTLELASDLSPWISGDPWRFRQVLLNLLSNAIKFTSNGSVTVKLSPRQVDAGDGVLLLEVIDTGIGIADDVQPKLFELFTQADPSDTRKYGGSGLGLAISKRLVELWGGHLGLDSQLGVGSRFWFSCGEAVVPQSLFEDFFADNFSIDTLDLPFVAARLLLVEDSLVNQEVLAALLSIGGHQVDLADCGAASIKAASTKEYDLIFMDVSMPDMTGMEATRRIRLLGGAAATVPIVAMTAHAFKGYEELCLAAGMNGFATKPINKVELLNLVQKWCRVSGNKPMSIAMPPIKPLASDRLVDETILQQFADNFGGDKLLSLLHIFMDELIKRQDTIKFGIEQQEVSVLRFEAHAIKSSAATFGATVLSVLATELEACSDQNDLPMLICLAEELLSCVEVTLLALQLYCKELGAVGS